MDWKNRLIQASSQTSSLAGRPNVGTNQTAVTSAVQQALKDGVSAEEVKAFVANTPALQGPALQRVWDDAFALIPSRREQTLIGAEPVSSTTMKSQAGIRAHDLRARVAGDRALPWHQRSNLPAIPPSTLVGGGKSVTVDGATFTPEDVAALLRAA